MSHYVTVPGWRRRMQALSGLGQDDDSFLDDLFSPTPAPYTGSLISDSAPAYSPDLFGTPTIDTTGVLSSELPASSSSDPLYTLFGTSGGTQTTTPLQTINWGNGQTGTYDATNGTYYDSNGNALSPAELAQYGSFTVGGPAGSSAIGSGLVSALSKIFSPSPAASVPARPGTVVAAPSIGSSLSGLILPIALFAGIALVLGKRR